MVTVEFLERDDLPVVAEVLDRAFARFYHGEVFKIGQQYCFNGNFDHSLALVAKSDGLIVGAYGFREAKIGSHIEDLPRAVALSNGLRGVVLGVDPDFHGHGVGSALIDMSRKIALDRGLPYVFGSHDKVLNNIEFWKKHRQVVYESDRHYDTLAIVGNEDFV
jgi:predicted N-acetyltransferase YhbS